MEQSLVNWLESMTMRVHPIRFLAALFVLAIVAIAALVIWKGVMSEAMISAVRAQNLARVDRLLRIRPSLATTRVMPQGSTNIRTRWMGAYVIHDAVRSGNVAIAEALADSGARLDVRLEGESLLHLAADHGHLDMMRWLVRKGLNPGDRNTCDACENAGRTPLHAVQRFRDDEGSALLLSLGADPNAADAAGRTPLHASASIGSSNGATVLCASGADPRRRDTTGRTPHEVALVSGSAPRGAHGVEARPGELAGWLAPGGGCEQLAAGSSAEQPAPQEEIRDTWRRHLCERDPSVCAESPAAVTTT